LPIFVILGSLALLFACHSQGFNRRTLKHRSYFRNSPPPGTVKIGPNLFIDKCETCNFSYTNFLYWQKRVYGIDSEEYLYSIPDQDVWSKAKKCLAPYSAVYLFHGTYRDYPVVGVSQNQALSYAAWRADRIFEFLLIKAKVIKPNFSPTKENYFSIKKYFAGKYENIVPDTTFGYPVFDLPTLENYKSALQISDQKKIHNNSHPCLDDSLIKDATVRTYWPHKKEKRSQVYNVRGNVREWTNERTVSFGGGWTDKTDSVAQKQTFISDSVNAWTGFRLVSKWVKWETKSD
jgi:hypothetical protein